MELDNPGITASLNSHAVHDARGGGDGAVLGFPSLLGVGGHSDAAGRSDDEGTARARVSGHGWQIVPLGHRAHVAISSKADFVTRARGEKVGHSSNAHGLGCTLPDTSPRDVA